MESVQLPDPATSFRAKVREFAHEIAGETLEILSPTRTDPSKNSNPSLAGFKGKEDPEDTMAE